MTGEGVTGGVGFDTGIGCSILARSSSISLRCSLNSASAVNTTASIASAAACMNSFWRVERCSSV